MHPQATTVSRSTGQLQPKDRPRRKRTAVAFVPAWIAVGLWCAAWWCCGTAAVSAQENTPAATQNPATEASDDASSAPTFDPRQPMPAMNDSQRPEAAFPAPPPRQPLAVQRAPQEAAPAKIEHAHDVLLLLGVEQSHLDMFKDGEPLSLDEEDALYRMLYAARRFPLSQLEAFTQSAFDIDQLVADPARERGEIFPLVGHVTRVIAHEPLPEVAERFLMTRYYECHLELDNNIPATIYTTNIPKAWQLDQEIREPVSALGIFVKLGGDREDAARSQPIFVAQRIAWHPDTFLGRLGMDVGLFDQVQQRRSLQSEDRECFYQLLHVAQQFDTQQLIEAARETQERIAEAATQDGKRPPAGLALTVKQLLDAPQDYSGQPFDVTGVLKRAIEIRVTDQDIRERYGIDHYYELQVLLDVKHVYRDDERDYRFFNYPITVCVRELPKGMPEGERLREFVRVPAVLMKVWSYQSEFSQQQGETKVQLGPLFIGKTIGWLRPQKTSNSLAGMIMGGLFVAALCGLFLIMWRYNQSDIRFRQRAQALPSQKPDLSGLADLDQRDS